MKRSGRLHRFLPEGNQRVSVTCNPLWESFQEIIGQTQIFRLAIPDLILLGSFAWASLAVGNPKQGGILGILREGIEHGGTGSGSFRPYQALSQV